MTQFVGTWKLQRVRGYMPLDSELKLLRYIRDLNSENKARLEGMIRKHRQIHNDANRRCTNAYEEFLSAQLQLSAAARSLMALEREWSNLLPEMEELNGLLHPIHRVPAEVLTEIFKLVIDEDRDTIRQPTLLHVCSRWRIIMAGNPAFWSQLTVDLAQPVELIQTIWRSVSSWRQCLPLDISIKNLGEDVDDVGTICLWNDVYNLNSLSICICTHDDAPLLEELTGSMKKPFHTLEIRRANFIQYDVDDEDHEMIDWDVFAFLRKLPSFVTLKFQDFNINISEIYSRGLSLPIQRLEFHDSLTYNNSALRLSNLLKRCSKLRSLMVGDGTSLSKMLEVSYSFQDLDTLELEVEDDLTEILHPKVQTPNLRSIDVYIDSGTHFRKIIRERPTIVNVSLHLSSYTSDQEATATLLSILQELPKGIRTLSLDWRYGRHLAAFYGIDAATSSPPPLSLQKLTIDVTRTDVAVLDRLFHMWKGRGATGSKVESLILTYSNTMAPEFKSNWMGLSSVGTVSRLPQTDCLDSYIMQWK